MKLLEVPAENTTVRRKITPPLTRRVNPCHYVFRELCFSNRFLLQTYAVYYLEKNKLEDKWPWPRAQICIAYGNVIERHLVHRLLVGLRSALISLLLILTWIIQWHTLYNNNYCISEWNFGSFSSCLHWCWQPSLTTLIRIRTNSSRVKNQTLPRQVSHHRCMNSFARIGLTHLRSMKMDSLKEKMY